MKTRFPVTLLLAALSSPNAFSATTIKYSGTLIAEPCMVETGSKAQTVDFGAISNKTFISHNRTLAEPFSIRLLKCDLTAGNNVRVTFNGPEASDQPGAFLVTGEAQGVAIVIEDSSGNDVKPGVAIKPAPLTGEETLLDYRAYVQSKAASAVTEGAFEAIVSFTLEYD